MNAQEVIDAARKEMNAFLVVCVLFSILGGSIGMALTHVYLPYDIINKCKLENAIKESQKCELYYRVIEEPKGNNNE